MKKAVLLFSSMIMILSLMNCSSGKKAFERGDYDEGLLKAINRLRSSPNNKKARETLKYGYPITIRWHQDNIARTKLSNNVFAHEYISYEYAKMNRIYNEIQRCPACLRVIPNPKTFVSEQAEAARKGAEVRYNLGEDLLAQAKNENDKSKAMDAFYHYEKANQLVNGYADTRDKMEEARWFATTKVVIEEVTTGSTMLDISAEFFYNKVQDFMMQMPVSPFVQFYSPKEAQSLQIETPDQIVRLKFDHFTVGQVYHKVEELVRTKDSVIVGQVKDSNGETLDVYGTANAKLIVNTKQLTSNGLLDLKIIDPYTSRVLTQEKLPGQYIWVSQWGNFNGDEEALYPEDWQIVNASEVPPPSPQDLFVLFTQPIYNQVTGKLSNFYSNYR
ncbi:MAG: hypothetical protein CMP59_12535 [Flavobacteriales bacterium]|nr:hypothetical protein [Flavobacteriales bacterium]